MIAGIGVDLVDIARFSATLDATPTLRERLFSAGETDGTIATLAGRFAAKEALIKALGGPIGNWHDVRVSSEASGAPRIDCSGAVAEHLGQTGIDRVHVSISHDGGFATAYVIVESNA